MNRTDDQLIHRYLQGDMDAFAALYGRYACRLMAFLQSLGADGATAEELAQAAWLKAIEALPRYRPRGRFRAWLFQVAHRTWLDDVRSARERRRMHTPELASLADCAAQRTNGGPRSPAEMAEEEEQDRRLEAALSALPRDMREVILLRLDGELTFREIARQTGAPLGTVLWRAREARQRLTRLLEE